MTTRADGALSAAACVHLTLVSCATMNEMSPPCAQGYSLTGDLSSHDYPDALRNQGVIATLAAIIFIAKPWPLRDEELMGAE